MIKVSKEDRIVAIKLTTGEAQRGKASFTADTGLPLAACPRVLPRQHAYVSARRFARDLVMSAARHGAPSMRAWRAVCCTDCHCASLWQADSQCCVYVCVFVCACCAQPCRRAAASRWRRMRLRACSSPRPRRTRRLWRSKDSGWKLDGVSDLVDSNGCSVSPDGFRCCGFGRV